MTKPRLVTLAAIWLAMPSASAAHCYSVWKFPWPQRCGQAQYHAPANPRIVPALPPARPKDDSIPLPDLSAREFVIGPVDDVTRARLELLGYAHAH